MPGATRGTEMPLSAGKLGGVNGERGNSCQSRSAYCRCIQRLNCYLGDDRRRRQAATACAATGRRALGERYYHPADHNDRP